MKNCLKKYRESGPEGVCSKMEGEITETYNTNDGELLEVDIVCRAPPDKIESLEAYPGFNKNDNKECGEVFKKEPKESINDKEFSSEHFSDIPRISNIGCLDKVQFDLLDEGMPDENDTYRRFYFESDHLALKNNSDYQLLLQTLVALEAQQKQAVKDHEKLIKLRNDAFAEPIKFVEKIQNNESLGIPPRQNIIKVPQINWENYAGTIDDFSQFSLLHQHNTRNSVPTAFDKGISLSANQRWEEQSTTSNGSVAESSQESFKILSNLDTSRYVRGKLATNDKSITFNQPWTADEQRKLERLLQVYPQETVEAKRWSKIANALGNRTPKQVASRVQKYFIKLAKSGLPIPGRFPNLNKILAKAPRPRTTTQQQQVSSFRNSTFFPSYQPRVFMEDNDNDDRDVDTLDDLDEISDDETIPEELRNTKEYMELLQLKRLKRKRAGQQMMTKDAIEHHGYMCDLCGMTPIIGVRWHCLDCPPDSSIDICERCIHKKEETAIHRSNHKLEPVNTVASDFLDGDYLKLGETSKGYNYLDPNFLPAAT